MGSVGISIAKGTKSSSKTPRFGKFSGISLVKAFYIFGRAIFRNRTPTMVVVFPLVPLKNSTKGVPSKEEARYGTDMSLFHWDL